MTTVKKVFLVHGEPGPQQVLAGIIKGTYGTQVEVPARGDAFEL